MFCMNALCDLPWVTRNCPHSMTWNFPTGWWTKNVCGSQNKSTPVTLLSSTAEMHGIIRERQWLSWETQAKKHHFHLFFSLKLLFQSINNSVIHPTCWRASLATTWNRFHLWAHTPLQEPKWQVCLWLSQEEIPSMFLLSQIVISGFAHPILKKDGGGRGSLPILLSLLGKIFSYRSGL